MTKKDYHKITIWNIPSEEKAKKLFEGLRTDNPETSVQMKRQLSGRKNLNIGGKQ
jgi:hypothetical protein